MERGQVLNCLFNESNIVDIYLFALPLQKARYTASIASGISQFLVPGH